MPSTSMLLDGRRPRPRTWAPTASIGCRRSAGLAVAAAADSPPCVRCRPRRRPCCGRAHPGAAGASSGRPRRPTRRGRRPAGAASLAGAGGCRRSGASPRAVTSRPGGCRRPSARRCAGGQARFFAGVVAEVLARQPAIGGLVGPVLAAAIGPAATSSSTRRRRRRRSSPARRAAAPAGFFRPRPPREPRRRRFFAAVGSPDPFDSGPFDSGSVPDSGRRYPAQCASLDSAARSLGASASRARSAQTWSPSDSARMDDVSVVVPDSSGRANSAIAAFSHDARAFGVRGRVSASCGSHRVPSRSIH